MRILPSSSLLGTQTLLVDAQGNGDYRSIQAALNAAAPYATAASRWSVRVAPGTYTEQLILKDYVDLIGLGPGRATRLKRANGALITAPAPCTLTNLWLEAVDTAALSLGSSFSGVLELDDVIIDQAALDVQSVQVAGGTLKINRSVLAAGGPFELAGGSLHAHHSVIRCQAASDGGQNMAIYVQGGTLLLTHCLVENVSPAGYGAYIDNTVASLKAYHTTFRKSTETYAIHASLSTAFTLAACSGNGALHPNLTGYHDYLWDATI
jgi:hypothetical protein